MFVGKDTLMDARVGATRLRRLCSNYSPSVPYLFPLPPPLLLPFPLPLARPFSLSFHFSFRFSLFFFLLSLYLVLLSVLSLFMDTLHPPLSQARRRSVDVGGLSLALGSQGLGQGWVGWDESGIGTEEQQLLYVIPLLPSTAARQPKFACSVLQNFLATCTIIRTLSSMPTNDRMSIRFLV